MPTTTRTAAIRSRADAHVAPDPARRFLPVATLALAFALALALGDAASAQVAAAPPAATPAAPTEVGRPDDVLIRLGDTTVTREQFEEEFEIAARSAALQQGIEPTPDVLAQFALFQPDLLEQLATQLVLVEHAHEVGLAAEAAEVDELLERVRADQSDEAGFQQYLELAGFRDEDALRAMIERSLTIQGLIGRLSAEIQVTDAEIEAWYDANQEQVQTPEGPLPLDAVRADIANLLVQQRVDERVQELVAEAQLEVFLDRL